MVIQRYIFSNKGRVWKGCVLSSARSTKLNVFCKPKMGRTCSLNSVANDKGGSFLMTICNGEAFGGADYVIHN